MLLKIRSINELLRVSGYRHLGGEEKIYFKEISRVEWIEAYCALKLIIFRYFAFFLELTFYLLLVFSFYIFLCTTFSGSHVRTVRTGSHAPGNHSNELEHLQDKVFSFSINLKAYHLYYMEYLLRKNFYKKPF